MTQELTKEIEEIIKSQNLNCSVKQFQDKVDWNYISMYQKLSEQFIEQFKEKVDWIYISKHQKLSEQFIEQFQDKVDWIYISMYQKLSEQFIEQFQDKVDWNYISQYQKLSEQFIEQFKEKVDWNYISQYQKLSEQFIEQFQDKVNWYSISQYQKLSEQFIESNNLTKPINNWNYVTKEEKLHSIKECGLYEIDGDYIIAYKSTRENGYSVYNYQYQYEVNKEYESHCDANLNNENSFGLSAWTRDKALEYHSNGDLFKVKIHLDNVLALVHDHYKLRCDKIFVVEKV